MDKIKFTQDNIFIDKNFETKKDLFTFIDNLALKNGISNQKQAIFKKLLAREAEGTTGMEKLFSIPHARSKHIVKPSIIVVVNQKKYSDWTSLDNQGVKYSIILLIPEKSSSFHINVLSSIAEALIDQEFQEIIINKNKNLIEKSFQKIINKIDDKNQVDSNNKIRKNEKYIVGVSACPAGIAHTFMVKKSMEKLANNKKIKIKWETQGANGQKNKLNKNDIENASTIIIASDIELDLSRFKNKSIYLTSTNKVIKNAKDVYEKALKDSQVYNGNKISIEETNKLWKKPFNIFIKSFKSNFGIPWYFLSLSVALLSIISLIGFSLYGQNWSNNALNLNKNLYKLQIIASFSLSLSMPIMGMFIIKSITKRTDAQFLGLISMILLNLPVLVSSLNSFSVHQSKIDSIFYDWNGIFSDQNITSGNNIFGNLIIIFVIPLLYRFLLSFKNKIENSKNIFKRIIHKTYSPWINPVLPAIVVLFVIVFLLGGPLSFVTSKLFYILVDYPQNYWWIRFFIGFIFGVLIAWDLGNTINKLTLIFLIGMAQYDLRFASIIPIGIPMASIGLGTTYFFHKKEIRKEDIDEMSSSFRKGLNGMSEGPLFIKHKYKWKVHIPNILSTGIACGLVMILGIYIIKGGHLGILFAGAQAHLSQLNDISFLNTLLPRGEGFLTVISSILYGIIGYYICMIIGCSSYLLISNITFRIGKQNKRIFKKI